MLGSPLSFQGVRLSHQPVVSCLPFDGGHELRFHEAAMIIGGEEDGVEPEFRQMCA